VNCCVVGVGNAFRGDDAAGLAVIRLLHDTVPDGVRLVECEGEPVSVIDVWDGCDRVVVVDAMQSGAAPGTIRRLVVGEEPLPAELRSGPSTHLLGIGEAIELARTLGRLPKDVIVYAVEGRDFVAGSELSAPVAAAVAIVAAAVHGEVAH
jgi:hydrogenase maturation protease